MLTGDDRARKPKQTPQAKDPICGRKGIAELAQYVLSVATMSFCILSKALELALMSYVRVYLDQECRTILRQRSS